MGTWVEKPLGEILKLTKGISYKSSDYGTEDDGIIFINLKCIAKSGGFSQRGIKYYKGIVPENLKLKAGDVIIANTDLTRNGDIVGCPLILPDFPNNDVSMSMDLSRLDLISDEVDGKFVYYALMTSSARKFMKENSSGSTVLHLKTSKVPLYKILIPSNKVEQFVIANILTTIDQSIEKTEQLIAKYERIKTGLMQDLLTWGVDEKGNIRSEKTHEFKDSVLGRIPKEWEVVKLKKALDIIDCKHITPQYIPEGIPLIRPRNVTSEGLDFKDIVYISYSDYIFLMDRHLPQKGDIVFTRNASFGNSSLLEEDSELAIGQDVVIMTKRDENINSKCIFFQLNFSEFQGQVTKLSGGSTFGRINLKILRELFLKLPSKEEQDRIENLITEVSNLIQSNKSQLLSYKNIKNALMQDLLTGKVRVDNLLPKN